MESGDTKILFEEAKEHWKKDFKELRDDIETLTKNINEFEEQMNKVKNLENLSYLSDCFDIEKTYFDFLN